MPWRTLLSEGHAKVYSLMWWLSIVVSIGNMEGMLKHRAIPEAWEPTLLRVQ